MQQLNKKETNKCPNRLPFDDLLKWFFLLFNMIMSKRAVLEAMDANNIGNRQLRQCIIMGTAYYHTRSKSQLYPGIYLPQFGLAVEYNESLTTQENTCKGTTASCMRDRMTQLLVKPVTQHGLRFPVNPGERISRLICDPTRIPKLNRPVKNNAYDGELAYIALCNVNHVTITKSSWGGLKGKLHLTVFEHNVAKSESYSRIFDAYRIEHAVPMRRAHMYLYYAPHDIDFNESEQNAEGCVRCSKSKEPYANDALYMLCNKSKVPDRNINMLNQNISKNPESKDQLAKFQAESKCLVDRFKDFIRLIDGTLQDMKNIKDLARKHNLALNS